tara:strand:- start:1390 stop:2484 length:1095 start_codon:yes stop_codon:yes gene_type:complete
MKALENMKRKSANGRKEVATQATKEIIKAMNTPVVPRPTNHSNADRTALARKQNMNRKAQARKENKNREAQKPSKPGFFNRWRATNENKNRKARARKENKNRNARARKEKMDRNAQKPPKPGFLNGLGGLFRRRKKVKPNNTPKNPNNTPKNPNNTPNNPTKPTKQNVENRLNRLSTRINGKTVNRKPTVVDGYEVGQGSSWTFHDHIYPNKYKFSSKKASKILNGLGDNKPYDIRNIRNTMNHNPARTARMMTGNDRNLYRSIDNKLTNAGQHPLKLPSDTDKFMAFANNKHFRTNDQTNDQTNGLFATHKKIHGGINMTKINRSKGNAFELMTMGGITNKNDSKKTAIQERVKKFIAKSIAK